MKCRANEKRKDLGVDEPWVWGGSGAVGVWVCGVHLPSGKGGL